MSSNLVILLVILVSNAFAQQHFAEPGLKRFAVEWRYENVDTSFTLVLELSVNQVSGLSFDVIIGGYKLVVDGQAVTDALGFELVGGA